MIPGELFTDAGEHLLNTGRRTLTLVVRNTGDRPIQVGSHYHFAETSPSRPPINTSGAPPATEPQAIAARNSAPVTGLFWNMTWPVPRRLTSTKRKAPEAAHHRCHVSRNPFTVHLLSLQVSHRGLRAPRFVAAPRPDSDEWSGREDRADELV